MAAWKLPPKAKIYEALTAVADKRVSVQDAASAEVVSSSGTKTSPTCLRAPNSRSFVSVSTRSITRS